MKRFGYSETSLQTTQYMNISEVEKMKMVLRTLTHTNSSK